MNMALHNEIEFEKNICNHLAANGWLYSPNDAGYDKDLALFPEDILGWLSDAAPDQLAKRVKPGLSPEAKAKAERAVLVALAKSLDQDPTANGGTLAVLRRGFKDLNAQFPMCQFKPNNDLTEATLQRYAKVRLRVIRQVHYSKKNQNCIDLVFFVNGIPVATAELKTDFTQSIADAVEQYKKDRDPKGEPLLGFGSRAVVHFAVSNDEVQMTTKLDGDGTRFLPFNRGNDHHAGNPINPDGSRTAYLWETILQRDTWLDILGKFMFVETEESPDAKTGKVLRKHTIKFPRFHQWEVVTNLVNTVHAEGPGHRYLIQHSAGSGKTNSISWLAHRLSSLHGGDNKAVFDTVIIITDRTVLDDQLKEAVRQIESKPGVVVCIDSKGGPKSAKLSEALDAGAKIVVVTIQTFPALEKYLQENKPQGGSAAKNFAIIADEAHSSQTGQAAQKLKQVLTPAEQAELEDGGEVSNEDVISALTAARANNPNLSFFAFTATPKAKTLELFGRPNAAGIPEPFHLYSMQQAIEEGFILDVLNNYTPYSTAFRLTHNGRTYGTVDDGHNGIVSIPTDETGPELVDRGKAVKSVMNWVTLHPSNISQKVQIIVEHFRQNVMWRLDGKAKAMVVTSTRRSAVRYKLAFDKYLAENGYTDVSALVAFSGEVSDDVSGVEKVTEKSKEMNPKLKGDIRKSFATDGYNVMLVANKFQTGFDQPLLVAMYVDKTLSGVATVQTLSRLNRTHPGKDTTFVVDFANTAESVVRDFEPYYRATTLSGVSDPNIVHQTMNRLDRYGFYRLEEIEGMADEFFGGTHEGLVKWVTPAVERIRALERVALDAGDRNKLDDIEAFRGDVKAFLHQYDFLSQIIDYEDPILEKTALYLRLLNPRIGRENLHHDIGLGEVDLEYVRHFAQDTVSPKLDEPNPLKPAPRKGGGAPADPEMVLLDEVIEQINAVFSEDYADDSKRNVIQHLLNCLASNETVQQQAMNNTLDQFSASPDLQKAGIAAVLDVRDTSEGITSEMVNDQDKLREVLSILAPVLFEKVRKGK